MRPHPFFTVMGTFGAMNNQTWIVGTALTLKDAVDATKALEDNVRRLAAFVESRRDEWSAQRRAQVSGSPLPVVDVQMTAGGPVVQTRPLQLPVDRYGVIIVWIKQHAIDPFVKAYSDTIASFGSAGMFPFYEVWRNHDDMFSDVSVLVSREEMETL